MKIFFMDYRLSKLCDEDSALLARVKESLFLLPGVEESDSPSSSDAIIMQERFSYKNFRYIEELLKDPIVAEYPHKVFTINTDDCATGILKGLYVSMPSSRFNSEIYRAVPYAEFPNELIFKEYTDDTIPSYLASWRGNLKSNKVRPKMVSLFRNDSGFCIETTNSWLNHSLDEKASYVNLIRNSKFTLCPAGWAPASFRIYESMAMGRCPVIIADQFVPPLGPDWDGFALFLPEGKIKDLSAFLEEHEPIANRMGANARTAWRSYFCEKRVARYYADSMISVIQSAANISKEQELKRWRSFRLQWSNGWTLLQRVVNRLGKI